MGTLFYYKKKTNFDDDDTSVDALANILGICYNIFNK